MCQIVSLIAICYVLTVAANSAHAGTFWWVDQFSSTAPCICPALGECATFDIFFKANYYCYHTIVICATIVQRPINNATQVAQWFILAMWTISLGIFLGEILGKRFSRQCEYSRVVNETGPRAIGERLMCLYNWRRFFFLLYYYVIEWEFACVPDIHFSTCFWLRTVLF